MGGCVSALEEKRQVAFAKSSMRANSKSETKFSMVPFRFEDAEKKYESSRLMSPQSTGTAASYGSQSVKGSFYDVYDSDEEKDDHDDIFDADLPDIERKHGSVRSDGQARRRSSCRNEFMRGGRPSGSGSTDKSHQSNENTGSPIKKMPRHSSEGPMARSWERVQAAMERTNSGRSSTRSRDSHVSLSALATYVPA